ncbi:coenzyme PQQ precursor peptide PqqA [Panacagrimonas perspica]|nr:coenzyme PQQ precursor peptide PqqA [Panacagrimonas perspica]
MVAARRPLSTTTAEEIIMAWTKPAAVDMRYGFEINLYIAAR